MARTGSSANAVGLQARRRLGLTATLVREDGKEDEVFCLIGPKRYDVPWKVLENQGFIATASCMEVRVPLEPGLGFAIREGGRTVGAGTVTAVV